MRGSKSGRGRAVGMRVMSGCVARRLRLFVLGGRRGGQRTSKGLGRSAKPFASFCAWRWRPCVAAEKLAVVTLGGLAAVEMVLLMVGAVSSPLLHAAVKALDPFTGDGEAAGSFSSVLFPLRSCRASSGYRADTAEGFSPWRAPFAPTLAWLVCCSVFLRCRNRGRTSRRFAEFGGVFCGVRGEG